MPWNNNSHDEFPPRGRCKTTRHWGQSLTTEGVEVDEKKKSVMSHPITHCRDGQSMLCVSVYVLCGGVILHRAQKCHTEHETFCCTSVIAYAGGVCLPHANVQQMMPRTRAQSISYASHSSTADLQVNGTDHILKTIGAYLYTPAVITPSCLQ